MKRFTLLVASLFMVLGAMAQTAVTDLSELSNDKKYFIESARCFLMYKPAASDSKLCTSNASGEAVERKMAVEAHQFNIISENNQYYLYSIGAGKYVSKDGSFVETKSDALTLENVGGNYPWKLCIGGNGLNSQIPGQMTEGIVVNSWTSADAGNCYQIIDVPADYVDPVYVSDLKDFNPNKAYTLTTKQRGAWTVNNELTELSTTSSAGQAVDATDTKQHFAVLTLDNENYYLFNIAANKFVKSKYTLVAAKGTPIKLNDATSEGANRMQIQYVGDANGYFNIGGSSQRDICGWSAIDHGNAVLFTEIADFDPAEALAMLANETADVTYNFICNGVTLATQTATVNVGEEFPKFDVTLPLGYSIAVEKPAGAVEATTTKEITVVVDNSLLPFNAVAEGTPTTWYYAQMHAHGSYHWFVAPAEDGSIATANHKFAASEVEAHLWGFVGTVEGGFKMVNKATSKAIKSTNSGVAAMASVEEATAFIAMGSQAGAKYFCLRHSNGNYLNSQSNVINHWYDNDNGSSFLLTEYVDEDVTVTVSELGWATKYFAEPVHVPADVNAYIVTGAEDGWITKSQIAEGEVIPANTGILLENAGEHKFAKTVTYNYTLADNLLNGSVENKYVEGTAYVLANHSEAGIGFYKAELNFDATGNKVAEGETGTHFLNNAGKAYLVLPAEQSTVAYYGFDWAGTTGIENVEVENASNVIYDLTGRRVEAITAPGIYIVGGKKVLVK